MGPVQTNKCDCIELTTDIIVNRVYKCRLKNEAVIGPFNRWRLLFIRDEFINSVYFIKRMEY
jgi:hypothetical protein